MELVHHLQNITNLIAAYKVYDNSFQLSAVNSSNASSSLALEFVHTIEALFFYNFTAKPEKLWDFIKSISHPSVTSTVEKDLNQIKTKVGKSRAWIHLVINDQSIASYSWADDKFYSTIFCVYFWLLGSSVYAT